MLLDEQPLFVLPSLAVKYGLAEAMVLQQLHYALGRDNVLVENGSRFVKLNLTWWQKQFPFWSESTIKRAIADLVKSGVVGVSRGREGNSFTIHYGQIDLSEGSNRPGETGQNDPSPCKREVGDRGEIEEGAEDGALFSLPADPKPKAKPKAAASEATEDVMKVWSHYETVFAGRFRLGLTEPRKRAITKGLKAVEGDVDICLRAIDGLKSYRSRFPDRSQDVGLSVIFETNMHSKSNLTEQISWWADQAEDRPTVTGTLSGVQSQRATQALLAAKEAREHPDDQRKKEKAEVEAQWLDGLGYEVSFDANGKPTLQRKAA